LLQPENAEGREGPHPLKITAICTTKNDWPVIACSCLHLARQGIDELIVLSSGATDQTVSGLRRLAQNGAPIIVVEEPAGLFHHAALTTILAHVAIERGADWIVPFDADEFMMPADPTISLRDVITAWSASDEPRSRRLQVRNFIVPSDTEEFTPETLEQSIAVAVPQAEQPLEDTIEAVRVGAFPFVCAPFPSKLVIAREEGLWVYAGAHETDGLQFAAAPADDAFIAHIPFRDRRSLDQRRAHGETIARLGYAQRHAWQSRLVAVADSTPGALDRAGWWRLNSLAEMDLIETGDLFVRDTRLATCATALRLEFAKIPFAGDTGDSDDPIPHIELDPASLLRAGVSAARAAECATEIEREQRFTTDRLAASAHQQALAAQRNLTEAQTVIETLQQQAAILQADAVRDTGYWRDRALHAESMRAEVEASRSWRLARALRPSRGRRRGRARGHETG
jgi:hypothetical protein